MTDFPFDAIGLDLDGTLLDHDDYSWAPAKPALDALKAKGCGVILASSKTAAEIAPLRAEMGLGDWPAIVENGAGVLAPGAGADGGDADYTRLRRILATLPAELRAGFQGFGDWGPEGIARETGLSPQAAALAARRSFSEPGLWLGSDEEREDFVSTARATGLTVQQGGRFLTLSFGGNKAERMMEVAGRYDRAGRDPFVVALGDAQNDVAMIEQADLGVIIPNPAHKGLPTLDGEATGRIIRAASAGPAGWNEVIMSLFHTAAKK